MLKKNENFVYKSIFGKISAYTTTYNAISYPFVESIKSMAGFADEVVVVDGCSDDGTWEKLQALAQENDKVKIYQNNFDWSEPGIDGMQKAYARALCENEYLWQFDVDELVHEGDYEKIKLITKRFPKQVDILHLPVVELWGDPFHCTGRRHTWKWRMSRNKPEITHAINAHARVVDEKTGRVYAKKGMSDGCEYVNTINYEMLPHIGFYNENFELARVHMQEEFARGMNQVFDRVPSIWHTSWMDIPRKLDQLKPGGVWDRMWSLLYQEQTQNRFPTTDFADPAQVQALVTKLVEEGGEESDQIKYKFKIERQPPQLLLEWYNRNQK